MSRTPNSNPIKPLSVGNVVSTALRLYRSHLQQYLGIALIAFLWTLLPFLVMIPFLVVIFLTREFSLIFLMIAVMIGLFIYCFPKYLTNSAMISRLAFQELIDKPESLTEARSQLKPLLWSFLRIALQIGCMLFGVYFVLGLFSSLIAGIFAAVLTPLFSSIFNPLMGQTIGFAIGITITVLILLAGMTWFFSLWMVAELPLAVEKGINGAQSIVRSWQLSKNSVFRIQGVVLVAFLVSIPLWLMTGYVPQVFLINRSPNSSDFWIIYAIALVISLAGNVVLLPFWQSIKAVLYYDLRSRREGLGLRLRDR